MFILAGSLYMLNRTSARFGLLKTACWSTPNVLGPTGEYIAAFAKVIANAANLVKVVVGLCRPSEKKHFECLHLQSDTGY